MAIASLLILCTPGTGHVEAAVSSCLLQSVSDIEVILVNAGASEVAKNLIQRGTDPRVRVSETTSQADSAIDAAISCATGENITLLGADDLCTPNFIADKLEARQRYSADVVFSLPRLIDQSGTPLPDSTAPSLFSALPETEQEIYAQLFYRGDFLCTRGTLISRDLFERVGRFHPALRHLQGFEYWRRIAPRARFHIAKHRYVRSRYPGEDNHDGSPTMRSERDYVYRRFFDSIPHDFVASAFAPFMPFSGGADERAIDIEQSLIYLTHRRSSIHLIGIDKLFELASKPDVADLMQKRFNMTISDIYRYLAAAAESAEEHRDNQAHKRRSRTTPLRAGLSLIAALRRRLGIVAT